MAAGQEPAISNGLRWVSRYVERREARNIRIAQKPKPAKAKQALTELCKETLSEPGWNRPHQPVGDPVESHLAAAAAELKWGDWFLKRLTSRGAPDCGGKGEMFRELAARSKCAPEPRAPAWHGLGCLAPFDRLLGPWRGSPVAFARTKR